MGNPLDHSRPLDVHRWSDFPEVNALIDLICESLYGGEPGPKRRKHLKVVILDLYVAWLCDVDMSPKAYQAKSRFNGLHISCMMIEVVRALEAAELIDLHTGYYDRITGNSRTTRIKAAPKLVQRQPS